MSADTGGATVSRNGGNKSGSRTGRILKRLIYVIIGLTVAVAVAASVATYVVFTPERITPIVLKYANKYLKATLDCESVDLTFYGSFPNLGVHLKNGSVCVPVAADSAVAADSTYSSDSSDSSDLYSGGTVGRMDTLLAFSDFVVSFNPIMFYRENRLIVRRARLTNPVVYARRDSSGAANWDILPDDDDSTSARPPLPEMNLDRVGVVNARVVYDDRRESVFVAAEGLTVNLGGSLTDVDANARVDALTVFYGGEVYGARLPLNVSARLKCDTGYRRFFIEHSTVGAGFVNFDIGGSLERDDETGAFLADLKFSLASSSLAELLAAIPASVFDAKQWSATGKLKFAGKLEGMIGNGHSPSCFASLQLHDGSLKSPNRLDKPLLRQLEIDCEARIDRSGKSPSFIRMDTLLLSNESARMALSGMFGDILANPFVEAKIDGDVDFSRLREDLPETLNAVAMGGDAQVSLNVTCFLHDLLALNYGGINANGFMEVNKLAFDWPARGLVLRAPSAKMRFGSRVTDSVRGREISSLFRASAEMDSLSFRLANSFSLNAGLMRSTLRTSEPKDSASLGEISAFVRLDHLRLYSADSSANLRATKLSAFTKVSPQADKPSEPELRARISIDTLRGRAADFAGRAASSALDVTVRLRDSTRRTRSAADSTLRRLRRDSMQRAHQGTSAVDFKLKEGEGRNFLSSCDMSGTFSARNIAARSPYFPLRTRLERVSLAFTSDMVAVDSSHLRVGASNIRLNGKVEGIRRALLRNGRITAALNAETDSLECNELIRALAAASDYAEHSARRSDSIARKSLDKSTDKSLEALDESAPVDSLPVGLFVVPRNLDIELNARMKKVRYGRFRLANADGKIIVRNGSVRIPELKIKSDMGDADIALVYKAPTTKGAYTGMDIQTEHVRMGELIRSIPVLDSLTPMIRSFEGTVACRITAVTELDSLSNVLMPATRASCYIKGMNMTLLDGETFSAIADKLHFKNKKRNVIDSMEVEMALEDSRVLVFPFVMTLDRYTVAIGGMQHLDMSFNYHISILKWPIPLVKIGLDIHGTPDKIHYSLASRKYADLATPVKTQSLENTVLNLRHELYMTLRKSMDEILNETYVPSRSASLFDVKF
jgi:hypothetical protein